MWCVVRLCGWCRRIARLVSGGVLQANGSGIAVSFGYIESNEWRGMDLLRLRAHAAEDACMLFVDIVHGQNRRVARDFCPCGGGVRSASGYISP